MAAGYSMIVQNNVDNWIKNNAIVLFAEDNNGCRAVKKMLSKYNVEKYDNVIYVAINLDQQPHRQRRNQYLNYLEVQTGKRTLPQLWIGQSHIGSNFNQIKEANDWGVIEDQVKSLWES